MNSITVITLLSLFPVCLGLLPAAAAAQGTVGPLDLYFSGSPAIDAAKAGSLAYFTMIDPPDPYSPPVEHFLRSDGTAQGTFSIDPRGPISELSRVTAYIQFVANLGNLLFFTSAKHLTPADRGLWRTDGTVAGTLPITQEMDLAVDGRAGDPSVVLAVPQRNLVFFSASPRSASPDFELWATDGTAAGTRLVKDVNPEGSSNPRRMIAFDGRLFFFADTPQGRELWRSDGTPAGTVRVYEFPKNDFEILGLVQAGGALFIVESTASSVEVWRSDGTEAGTEQVLDLPQRLHESLVPAGRNLFIVVHDPAQSHRHEIWAVDTGTADAVQVLEVETIQDFRLSPAGNRVVFPVEDDHGLEPWWSDGTPEGTQRMADICPGPCSSFQRFAGTHLGRVLLLADDGVSGTELWLSDGAAAGTWRIADLCPGECSGAPGVLEINGWLALRIGGRIWISDGSPDSAMSVGDTGEAVDWLPLPGRLILFMSYPARFGALWSLPVSAAPPPGAWLESVRVPGFRFKVQFDGQTAGRQESACMARTVCVSGAVPGRSEVFLLVSGPGPDGRFSPSLVKLTTSAVDIWIWQTATGSVRHYRLNGSSPTSSTLAGILDREGFLPDPDGLAAAVDTARAKKDPQPPGRWIESKTVPGFRVQARLTSDGKSRVLRKEPCIAETFCLSGATPGLTELLVRVSGPRPNGYFWPMIARFAPATLEVWVQQRKTGKIRYYRLNAPPAGSSQLDGYFDRQGFKR